MVFYMSYVKERTSREDSLTQGHWGSYFPFMRRHFFASIKWCHNSTRPIIRSKRNNIPPCLGTLAYWSEWIIKTCTFYGYVHPDMRKHLKYWDTFSWSQGFPYFTGFTVHNKVNYNYHRKNNNQPNKRTQHNTAQHTHKHTRAHTHTHTRIHTHTRTRIHTHIHTRIHTLSMTNKKISLSITLGT
jgi:hypothetical protein